MPDLTHDVFTQAEPLVGSRLAGNWGQTFSSVPH